VGIAPTAKANPLLATAMLSVRSELSSSLYRHKGYLEVASSYLINWFVASCAQIVDTSATSYSVLKAAFPHLGWLSTDFLGAFSLHGG
jgi:hypothetical protein